MLYILYILRLHAVFGLAGEVDAQAFENLFVHWGEDDGGVDLAALELGELLHGQLRQGVGGCADGQGNQGFVGVQPGIPVAQVGHLQVLDGVQDHRGHQVHLVRHT